MGAISRTGQPQGAVSPPAPQGSPDALVEKAERAAAAEVMVARRARTPSEVVRDELEHASVSTRVTKNYLINAESPTALRLEQLARRSGGAEPAFTALRELIGGSDLVMESPHFFFVARCVDSTPFDATRWKGDAGSWLDWYEAALAQQSQGAQAFTAFVARSAELLGMPAELSSRLLSPLQPGQQTPAWNGQAMREVHELLHARSREGDAAALAAAVARLPATQPSAPSGRLARAVTPSPERARRNLEKLTPCVAEAAEKFSPKLSRRMQELASRRAELAPMHDAEDTLVARLPRIIDVPMGQLLPCSQAERDRALASYIQAYAYLLDAATEATGEGGAARAVVEAELAHDDFGLWAHLGRVMLARSGPDTGRTLADELERLRADGQLPYPWTQLFDTLVEEIALRRERCVSVDGDVMALSAWLACHADCVPEQRRSLAWLDAARAASVPALPEDYVAQLEQRARNALAVEVLAPFVAFDAEDRLRTADVEALKAWAKHDPLRALSLASMLDAEARRSLATFDDLRASHVPSNWPSALRRHEILCRWTREVGAPELMASAAAEHERLLGELCAEARAR